MLVTIERSFDKPVTLETEGLQLEMDGLNSFSSFRLNYSVIALPKNAETWIVLSRHGSEEPLKRSYKRFKKLLGVK